MKLLLLDADVIIDFHRLGLWKQITKICEVYASSTVLHNETYFYENETGRHIIDINNIKEVSAKPQEIAQLSKKFDPSYLTIDAGELESLTILYKQKGYIFCTCDRSAIIALSLIGLIENGISVENLIKRNGLSVKNLEPKHSEKRFRDCLNEGSRMKIQGNGLL